MKKDKIIRTLFFIMWIVEAAALILLSFLYYFPKDSPFRRVFWILFTISAVLVVCIKWLDQNGTVFSGEFLKEINPKLYVAYNLTFILIIFFMVIVGLFGIQVSEG